MSGVRMRNFCFAMIAMALMNPLQAVEIKYNEDNRPVEFIDLDIKGESWFVSVNWDGRMIDTYGVNGEFVEPTFYGEDAVNDAATAMQQALINDSYTGTNITSYLWVPKSYHSTLTFSSTITLPEQAAANSCDRIKPLQQHPRTNNVGSFRRQG